MSKIAAPKGFEDILPADSWKWHAIEAIAREVSDPLSPLAGLECEARPDRLAQFDGVRQGLRRLPFSQHDFTQRKAGDNAEFIGRAVDRIPERFKSPATALSKHLLAPNTFVRRFLPRFEPRASAGWVAADGDRRVGGILPGKWDVSESQEQQCSER